MNGKHRHDGTDATAYERSPSGGYELVYHIMHCDAPSCDATGVVDTDPDTTAYVCENHTLDEFEEIAEVKVRA